MAMMKSLTMSGSVVLGAVVLMTGAPLADVSARPLAQSQQQQHQQQQPQPPPNKVEARQRPTRPPVTGKEVAKGTAQDETGAKDQGKGKGLTFGGGADGGAVGQLDVADFCCPEFLDAMIRQIRDGWNSRQPNHGATVMKFTVLRDGTISDVIVEKGSGYVLLDIASRRAIPAKLRLPLPAQYPENQLVVHLTFPYDK